MSGSAKRSQGKPEAFTPQQRDVLFNTLRRVVSEEENRTGGRVTGVQIGEWLGIKQQSVSRFLAGRGAGIQYGTASALARKAGFRSLDALFEAYGVLPGQGERMKPSGDPVLDSTIELALIQGVEESVISHTIEENRNEDKPEDFGRRQRWWMKRFLSAQELVDRARLDPPQSAPRLLKSSN